MYTYFIVNIITAVRFNKIEAEGNFFFDIDITCQDLFGNLDLQPPLSP